MSGHRYPQARRLASIALVVMGFAIAASQLAQAAVSPAAGSKHMRGGVLPLPTLTVNTPPAAVEIGAPATFTGTISPARRGSRVVLLRLIRGRWKLVAVGSVVDATGVYTIVHVFRIPSGGAPAALRIATHRRQVFQALQVSILRHPRRQDTRHRQIAEERRIRHRHAVEERERLRRQQRLEEKQHRQQLAEERRRHRQELAEAKRKAAEEKRNAAKEKRQHAAEERHKRAEERRLHASERHGRALRG